MRLYCLYLKPFFFFLFFYLFYFIFCFFGHKTGFQNSARCGLAKTICFFWSAVGQFCPGLAISPSLAKPAQSDQHDNLVKNQYTSTASNPQSAISGSRLTTTNTFFFFSTYSRVLPSKEHLLVLNQYKHWAG